MKFFHLLLCIIFFQACVVVPKTADSGNPTGWQYGENFIFSKNWKNKELLFRERQGREPGWELGIAFIPKIDGRISAIHIRNPTIGNVPITLWDGETMQPVFTLNASLSGVKTFQRVNLPESVFVKGGRKYCITINVEKYYYHLNVIESGWILEPVHFQFLGSVYEETHIPRFPIHITQDVIHGIIDFDAQWKIN